MLSPNSKEDEPKNLGALMETKREHLKGRNVKSRRKGRRPASFRGNIGKIETLKTGRSMYKRQVQTHSVRTLRNHRIQRTHWRRWGENLQRARGGSEAKKEVQGPRLAQSNSCHPRSQVGGAWGCRRGKKKSTT